MTGSLWGDDLPHQPVLYKEIIHALHPSRGGLYIDATIGAGGHAWGILEASSPTGRLLGLDLDPYALDLARQRLAAFGSRAVLVHASFTELSDQMGRLGWEQVDGVLIDLGVSSMQLDDPARGFSFQADGPLDMRFNPDAPQTASNLVNGLPEAELAEILFRFGEERKARQIARAIVNARPLSSTRELASLVAGVLPSGRRVGIHPATRTFQALRIAVNQELQALEAVLPQIVAALAPGGRLAVVAFHSLEDRLVKRFLRQESQDCICPPAQPVCTCGHLASLRLITRKPIRPGSDETARNPRARSARLRVAEKKVA